MDEAGLLRYLPAECAGALRGALGDAAEIRLRAGSPAEIVRGGAGEMIGPAVSARQLQGIAAAMLDNSLYAWENQLRQGFFTLPEGCRVGVTGRCVLRDGRVEALQQISALCVRLAREVKGCAGPIVKRLLAQPRPMGALIVSAPGMGKTTCLRDAARQLSLAGLRVAVADERGEIAALRDGAPTLDVGPRTDVMDGCPKAIALPMLVRAMAPQLIVTDEMGGEADAEAVLDAARCGVSVVTSVHAGSFREAEARPGLGDTICAGLFGVAALLGPRPGEILALRTAENRNGSQREEDACCFAQY